MLSAIPAVVVHVTAAALALVLLVLVGQPIYANDTWIHLGLGEYYLASGPFLERDPFLFAAPGPPAPSSWLGAAIMASTVSVAGFAGLRALHVLLGLAILGLAFGIARRATGSAVLASATLVAFVALATYRLVQLRPELFSIAATLALVPLLLAPRDGPDARRIVAAAGVAAVWANIHAAFVLGPVLVLGTAASLFALDIARRESGEPADRLRARRIAIAGVAMLLGSALNPLGPSAHLAFFEAGGETLELAAVTDEWARTNLLAAPLPNRIPTWPAWLLSWASLAAVAVGAIEVVRFARRPGRAVEGPLDPALFAFAVAGLGAALLATRFLWLELFALTVGAALCADAMRRRRSGPSALAVVLAFAVPALAAAYLRLGDWPLVSRSLVAGATPYSAAYYPGRFHGHAMRFLAETGMEGRVLNPYPLGGFMGYWLGGRLQLSSSGTMNVERAAMEEFIALGQRRAPRAGESFVDALDRHGIEVFVGTGLPIEPIPGRRDPASTTHLEGQAGWVPVFRNLRGALYLRRDGLHEHGERQGRRDAIQRDFENAGNLDRVERFYRERGLPFDRAGGGVDLRRLIDAHVNVAIEWGVVPQDFASLRTDAEAALREGFASPPVTRLALLFGTLGLYDRVLEIEGRLAAARGADAASFRRRIWALLHLGRLREAGAVAERLDAPARRRGGAAAWTEIVAELASVSPDERALRLTQIPFFRSESIHLVLAGLRSPTPMDPEARRSPR